MNKNSNRKSAYILLRNPIKPDLHISKLIVGCLIAFALAARADEFPHSFRISCDEVYSNKQAVTGQFVLGSDGQTLLGTLTVDIGLMTGEGKEVYSAKVAGHFNEPGFSENMNFSLNEIDFKTKWPRLIQMIFRFNEKQKVKSNMTVDQVYGQIFCRRRVADREVE